MDAGLNETSCFFEDGDGAEVEHGYYFEEVGSNNPYFTYSSDSFSRFKEIFTGGDFTYDSSRRKVTRSKSESIFFERDVFRFFFKYRVLLLLLLLQHLFKHSHTSIVELNVTSKLSSGRVVCSVGESRVAVGRPCRRMLLRALGGCRTDSPEYGTRMNLSSLLAPFPLI